MSRTIFLISLLFFSSSLFAQEQTTPKANITQSVTHSALLRAEGKSIRVNGAAVPSTMTIFSEDRVDTGADTAAIFIMGGRILTLDRNSSAVFRNGTLVLSQGKAWLAHQNGSAPGTITRLAAARVTATAPLAADETSGQGENPSSNDHFTGTCQQFPKACDQAEDACEKKNHRECVCTYKSDHDKDDISPIRPDSDDFQCQPVGDRCRNDDCGD
jgi:hypothetical protein